MTVPPAFPPPVPDLAATPARLDIRAVTGIGEIAPGTDLAAVLVAAAPWLASGDVLVVTSKIISKAEGHLVRLPDDPGAAEAARQAALSAQTARVVARRGPTRIVQTHHGLVLASAGIDASNVDSSYLVLLPVDPDASARALRAALADRYGRDVAVVITDTMGRPWRLGLTDVAIGAAGLGPVRDFRGAHDRYGNQLRLTQMAVIDEIAAAAELVKGKFDQVPAAVVRGLSGYLTPGDGPGAAALVRDAAEDMFSLGTAEARALGRRDAATITDVEGFGGAPVPPEVLDEVLGVAPGPLLPLAGPEAAKLAGAAGIEPGGAAVLVPCAQPDPVAAAWRGAGVHRIRAAAAAAGLVSSWSPLPPATIASVAEIPDDLLPLGLLVLGHPAR